MPTYEYECLKCGRKFELFQSMTEKPRKRCPECRGKVRRVFGVGAGVLFKGSGFYQTDYRSDSYRQQAKKEKESGTAEKKGDVGSDKKGSAGKPGKSEGKGRKSGN